MAQGVSFQPSVGPPIVLSIRSCQERLDAVGFIAYLLPSGGEDLYGAHLPGLLVERRIQSTEHKDVCVGPRAFLWGAIGHVDDQLALVVE